MIIPSIDIMSGRAVQLKQGKEKVIEQDNIWELAENFSRYGEIAVIDLDAAMGKGSNKDLIKELCMKYDCRVGGGIRDLEIANEYLTAGAKKIIIGTAADTEFLSKLPKSRLIVAIDTKKGYVVTNGWTKSTGTNPLEIIEKLEDLCSGFLFTDVDREGLLEGIKMDDFTAILEHTNTPVTFAGGVSSIADIIKLEDVGADVQIGMALYTGKIDLQEAFISLIDFSKNDGLVPTIVEDNDGQILMQAFSNRESLKFAFNENSGIYFSRSRKTIWKKGETSGFGQQLHKVRYDCDRDTLLFTVTQSGIACHTGQYSCFGDRRFNLRQLYDVISDRVQNPKPDSYTSKLAQDEVLIKQKLLEEMQEVINYEDRVNLVWEVADVTYFLLMILAKNEISFDEVLNELWRRRK